MSKITQLTEDVSPTGDDLMETVQDPAGTPLSRKVKIQNLLKRLFLGDATMLTITTIADGEFLKRSGSNITSAVPTGTVSGSAYELLVACSNLTTALAVTTAQMTFPWPRAVTLSSVHAFLVTPQTGGSIFTVDVNEAGSSILSTKITIDNGEADSTTAATQPVLSDTGLAAMAKITVDIDQVGDGTAKGLYLVFIGVRV